MLDDPEKLMRKAYITVAGGVGHTGANGQASLKTFSVYIDPIATMAGFTTGISGWRGKVKDRPIVFITAQANLQTPPPADHFNAYYVPMVQVSDVNNGNSHYTLPTAAGSNPVAITSQITACVFSMGSDANGAVLVSHVQPPSIPGATRNIRQAAAIVTGGTHFHGGFTQVRHGKDYDMDSDRVAIIGRLSNQHWKFYMQLSRATGIVYSVRSAAKVVEI